MQGIRSLSNPGAWVQFKGSREFLLEANWLVFNFISATQVTGSQVFLIEGLLTL